MNWRAFTIYKYLCIHKQQYNFFGQQLHALAAASALGSTKIVIFVTTIKGIGIKAAPVKKMNTKVIKNMLRFQV
jgi:hypothetical protein